MIYLACHLKIVKHYVQKKKKNIVKHLENLPNNLSACD